MDEHTLISCMATQGRRNQSQREGRRSAVRPGFRDDDENGENDSVASGIDEALNEQHPSHTKLNILHCRQAKDLMTLNRYEQVLNLEHGDFWMDSVGREVHRLLSAETFEPAEQQSVVNYTHAKWVVHRKVDEVV